MIYLIAPRIKLAESASFFLKLPRSSWRFVIEEHHIQSIQLHAGDLFIWVNAPSYSKTRQDYERQDYIAAFIKDRQIHALEYTLP